MHIVVHRGFIFLKAQKVTKEQGMRAQLWSWHSGGKARGPWVWSHLGQHSETKTKGNETTKRRNLPHRSTYRSKEQKRPCKPTIQVSMSKQSPKKQVSNGTKNAAANVLHVGDSETILFKGWNDIKQHSTVNCHCKGDGTALLILDKTDFQSKGSETKSHLSNSSAQHSEQERLKAALWARSRRAMSALSPSLNWTEDSCQWIRQEIKASGFWKTKQNYLLTDGIIPYVKNLSHLLKSY